MMKTLRFIHLATKLGVTRSKIKLKMLFRNSICFAFPFVKNKKFKKEKKSISYVPFGLSFTIRGIELGRGVCNEPTN